MQVALGSWMLSSLLFVTLPISLLGGTLVALLQDGLSIATGAGLLALLAWAARTGMVFIDRLQHLERDRPDASSQEMVTQAAQERVAPVLTTAFAMALALAPFMVMGFLEGKSVV